MAVKTQQDPYGLGQALSAYQHVYTGLIDKYQAEYDRLGRAYSRIDALKGDWLLMSSQFDSGCPPKFSDPLKEKAKVIEAMKKMEIARDRSFKLLEYLRKGREFMENKPIPEFDVSHSLEGLEKAAKDLGVMERRVELLSKEMKRRVDLAENEGNKVCDRLDNGAATTVGDYVRWFTGWGNHSTTQLETVPSSSEALHVFSDSEEELSTGCSSEEEGSYSSSYKSELEVERHGFPNAGEKDPLDLSDLADGVGGLSSGGQLMQEQSSEVVALQTKDGSRSGVRIDNTSLDDAVSFKADEVCPFGGNLDAVDQDFLAQKKEEVEGFPDLLVGFEERGESVESEGKKSISKNQKRILAGKRPVHGRSRGAGSSSSKKPKTHSFGDV